MIFRPVGLMRSPMMTKGRSKPITTSLVAELMMVSVTLKLLEKSRKKWRQAETVYGVSRPGYQGTRPFRTPDLLDDLGHRVSSCR